MVTKITLSGGFHNNGEINIFVDIKNRALIDWNGDKDTIGLLRESMTPYQRKRLEKHFCGIRGCVCGSWERADIDTTHIAKNAKIAEEIERMRNGKHFPFYEKHIGFFR